MFDASYKDSLEVQRIIYNLEWFAERNFPDREDLWPKSVFLALSKMNPEWASEYLRTTGQEEMLRELESGTTEFLAYEAWQSELQGYWRQERDPDGVIDAHIRSRCPEEGVRQFIEVKK